MDALEDTRDVVTRLVLEHGPALLAAVLIMIVGYFVMGWAAKLAARGLNHVSMEPPVRDLLLRGVKVLVLLLFLLIALQTLGVELLPLIAGLGIAGAAVALALQGVLGDVAAGLTIIFTRPFRVGEYISVADEEGEVLDISLFATTLRHADLSRVVIPNRKIAGEILHNYGEIRQLDLRIALAYAMDLERRHRHDSAGRSVEPPRADRPAAGHPDGAARRAVDRPVRAPVGQGPRLRCGDRRDQLRHRAGAARARPGGAPAGGDLRAPA